MRATQRLVGGVGPSSRVNARWGNGHRRQLELSDVDGISEEDVKHEALCFIAETTHTKHNSSVLEHGPKFKRIRV